MSGISKVLMSLIISQIFCACYLYSQTSHILSHNDKNEFSIPWIDGTPLLKTHNNISADFYKKNPDFLKTNKLNKTYGWNFSVGSKKEWFTFDFATEQEYPTATTCRAIGKYCYLFVQDSMWNTLVNQSYIDSIVDVFDNRTYADSKKGIYQTNTSVFGQPPDIDNDQKIIILLLDIKDSYNSISGFYSSGNQLPSSVFAYSNEAEILFIDVNKPFQVSSTTLHNQYAVIAHEFQHMITWNYDNQDLQWTFINEGCSLAAEIINGFPIYKERFFTCEPNHYLFDWRGDSAVVVNDYSRAAKFHVYLYDQFGPDIFKNIVQSGKVGLENYNYAFEKIGSNLKLDDVVANWFVANYMLDRSLDPKYGYLSNEVKTNTVGIIKYNPEGNLNIRIEPYSSECVFLESGKNVKIDFSSLNNLKIKGIFSGDKVKKIVDINPNGIFSDPELGTIYHKCAFVIYNLNYEPGFIECKFSGERNWIELKCIIDRSTGVLLPNPVDTTGVAFDAMPGGKLDSIKIPVYRSGKLTGRIYKHPIGYGDGKIGGLIPVAGVVPLSNLFTVVNTSASTLPFPFPYPIPPNNWLTIDLRNENISTDEAFFIGIGMPEDTSTFPRMMISRIRSYDYNINCYYSANAKQWVVGKYPFDKPIPIVMISAFVSFPNGTTKVIENEPLKYSLMQNYPNPFNPETFISFSIPRKGRTSLKIYDIMGREVKTVMNEVKEAGNHIVKFSANNLSSGVYFYRIVSNEFADIKKMILMK